MTTSNAERVRLLKELSRIKCSGCRRMAKDYLVQLQAENPVPVVEAVLCDNCAWPMSEHDEQGRCPWPDDDLPEQFDGEVADDGL